MNIAEKVKLLKDRKINYVTNKQQTQIIVESVWFDSKTQKDGSDWQDMTEASKTEMYDFLGY